jgi:hypothetical protein
MLLDLAGYEGVERVLLVVEQYEAKVVTGCLWSVRTDRDQI